MIVFLAIFGAIAGVVIAQVSPRMFPKYKPGTVVTFDGDITGIYLRRSSWPNYHRVLPTAPDWYSAVRERREVTVHGGNDRMRPA